MQRLNVTCTVRELELKQPFTIARGTKEQVANVFVTLENAEGTKGYGEAAPNGRYDEDAESVTRFIGNLPDDFFNDIETGEELEKQLAQQTPQVKSAAAAVEMAWFDLQGKTDGLPLWKLWDAPSNHTPPTSYTIGLDDIGVMREKVSAADEYPVLKVKLGTGPERDREIIRAIREITDKPLRIDANEGWPDPGTAQKQIAFLADQGIELVEQPLPSAMIEQMIALKKYSPLPLVADESFTGSEDLDLIARAFDGINIKLMKTGSLVTARRLIAKAEELDLSVMVGCMIESSLANAAGALIGLGADYVDLDGHLLISDDPAEGLTLDADKQIVLSDNPGLGITIRDVF